MNFVKQKAMTHLLESLDSMPCTKPSRHGIHTTGGGEYSLSLFEDPLDTLGDTTARNAEDAQAMFELAHAIEADEDHMQEIGEPPVDLPQMTWHQSPEYDRFPNHDGGHQCVPFSISDRDAMLGIFEGYYRRLEADVRKFNEHIEEMHAGDFRFAAGRVLKMYEIRVFQIKLKVLSAQWPERQANADQIQEWRKSDDVAEANALNEDFRKGEIK